jgi:hypothetical protein
MGKNNSHFVVYTFQAKGFVAVAFPWEKLKGEWD